MKSIRITTTGVILRNRIWNNSVFSFLSAKICRLERRYLSLLQRLGFGLLGRRIVVLFPVPRNALEFPLR